jgi:methyl-accepting chemotaxis protein
MALKQLWMKIDRWWSAQFPQTVTVPVDEEGLISQFDTDCSKIHTKSRKKPENAELIVKKVSAVERKDNVEVLGQAFNKLIDKLQGINEHLDKQIDQHEQLMERIEKLPDLLESLPNAVENQKQVVESLLEQLKTRAVKDRQFTETIEKIPSETAKQTNAVLEMNHKLSVATDIDAQMSENFNKFNKTLGKLDSDTVSQTESILRMNKTFTASDRYLKYIISKQGRRFMWIFMTSLAVCTFSIISLIVCILLILNR